MKRLRTPPRRNKDSLCYQQFLRSKHGEVYIDTLIKLLISCMLGVILLLGLRTMFSDSGGSVLMGVEMSISNMFDYSTGGSSTGDESTTGSGSSGSGASSDSGSGDIGSVGVDSSTDDSINDNADDTTADSDSDTTVKVDPVLATSSTVQLSSLAATSIVFETSVTVDLDSVIYWDVSEAQDESVVAYTTSDGVTHIANNTGSGGKVIASSGYKLFYNCTLLESIDCTNLDTSNVTSMYWMLYGCSSLEALDVSSWDTSNVTSMYGVFWYCSSLTSLDVSSWDTSNVTSMACMFNYCVALTTLDVSNWCVSKVASMDQMFFNCSSLTTIFSNDTWTPTRSASMFYGCKSLVGGNGTAYSNSCLDSVYARPDTDDTPGYFTATN